MALFRHDARPMRLLLTFVVLAGAGAVLAGCGDTAKTAVATPDACKMVDPTAAAEILGEAVTPKPITPAGAADNKMSLCNYETATLHHGFMVTVGQQSFADVTKDSASEMAANVKSSEEALPDLKIALKDLTGLGDAAYLLTTDAYVQVYVYARSFRVMINRNVAPTPEAVDVTEKIAKLALAALP